MNHFHKFMPNSFKALTPRTRSNSSNLEKTNCNQNPEIGGELLITIILQGDLFGI